MREIKFKRYFQHEDTGNICCIQIDQIFGIQQPPSARHFQIGLSQYTGLTDRNGKGREMYEGDVYKQDGRHYLIEWSEWKNGWTVRSLISGSVIDSLLKEIATYDDFEYIGSIHEHPHLLERGEVKT